MAKAFAWTEKNIAAVYFRAAAGDTKDEIAAYLGITKEKFQTALNRNSELKSAYDRGRAMIAGDADFLMGQKELATIEKEAALFSSLEEIAVLLGIRKPNLEKYLKDPAVKEAYDRGKARGMMRFRKKAMECLENLMEGGDIKAATFFLERKDRWVTQQEEQKETHAEVVVYFPERGSLGDY